MPTAYQLVAVSSLTKPENLDTAIDTCRARLPVEYDRFWLQILYHS